MWHKAIFTCLIDKRIKGANLSVKNYLLLYYQLAMHRQQIKSDR